MCDYEEIPAGEDNQGLQKYSFPSKNKQFTAFDKFCNLVDNFGEISDEQNYAFIFDWLLILISIICFH